MCVDIVIGLWYTDAMETLETPRIKSRRAYIRKPIQEAPNAIQGLRLIMGISAAELARRIGVAPSQIWRAERAGTGLGGKNWDRCAEELHVKTWELHDPTLPAKISSFDPLTSSYIYVTI